MNKGIPVSGWIICQDEEHYIKKAINNLLPNVSEIIVVDGGSKDDTVKIAKDLGCTVFKNKFEFDFAKQRNFAMSKCKNEWTITLDADETFSKNFYNLLPTLIMNPPGDAGGFNVWRVSIFDGEEVGKEYQPRVMNKNFCHWNGKIHEQLLVKEKTLFNLPEEFNLFHKHSLNRQRWANALYFNINNKIKKRPKDTDGMESHDEKWIEVKTERNG